jgi:hypothetical protein
MEQPTRDEDVHPGPIVPKSVDLSRTRELLRVRVQKLRPHLEPKGTKP